MKAAGWIVSVSVDGEFWASLSAVPAAVCRRLTLGRRRFVSAGATLGRTAVALVSGRVETRTLAGETTAVLAPTCAELMMVELIRLGVFRAPGVSGAPAGAADPDASRAGPAWVFPAAHGLRFSGDVEHE